MFQHLYSAYYGGLGIMAGGGTASDMYVLGHIGMFAYVEDTSFKIYRNSVPADYKS